MAIRIFVVDVVVFLTISAAFWAAIESAEKVWGVRSGLANAARLLFVGSPALTLLGGGLAILASWANGQSSLICVLPCILTLLVLCIVALSAYNDAAYFGGRLCHPRKS